MSYPDARYLGEGGEATATLRAAGAEPELDGRTAAVSYLATGAGTDGSCRSRQQQGVGFSPVSTACALGSQQHQPNGMSIRMLQK